MSIDKIKNIHEEHEILRENMSKVNTDRGSTPENLQGFYAENANAAAANMERIRSGIAARERVIDDNGPADSAVFYKNGQTGRKIQDKSGYTASQLKKMIESGKYDNMVFRINKDNSIFQNEEKLTELKAYAKKRHIKIVASEISKEELTKLSERAIFEGEIRKNVGLDATAPLSTAAYCFRSETSSIVTILYQDDILPGGSNIKTILESEFHQNGIDNAASAACYECGMEVAGNILKVMRGDKNMDDAICDIAYETAAAGGMGYISGVVGTGIRNGLKIDGPGADLMTEYSLRLGRVAVNYVRGDLSYNEMETELLKTSYMMAARQIGREIGKNATTALLGSVIGPGVGNLVAGKVGEKIGIAAAEMITTVVCATIIDTVEAEKRAERYNSQMLALARQAEQEIRAAQTILEAMIREENMQLLKQTNKGFAQMMRGISENNYAMASGGILQIGGKFNLTAEQLHQGDVKKGAIFSRTRRTIILE